MSTSSPPPEPLPELISAHADGRLDDQQWKQLVALLHGSAEARAAWIEHGLLEHMLRCEARRGAFVPVDPQQPPSAGEPAATPSSPILGFLYNSLHVSGDTPGVTAFMWLVVAALTGMTLMAVLLVVLTIRGVHVTVEPPEESRQQAVGSGQKGEGEPEPEAVPAVAVARLSRMADCRWTLGEDEQEPAAGDDLVEGQVLRLKSGLAEILFRSGARTLLQGPARLELLSRNSAQLHRGTLTARVEVASAKGFTIHTPAMKLVDLGTEFGVLVKRDGAEEVHVFRGTVQAERVAEGGRRAEGGRPRVDGEKSLDGPPSPFRLPPSPLVLSANQALRFDAQEKTVVRQAAAPEQFARKMPDPEPFPIFGTGVGLDPGQNDPHWQIVADSTNPNFQPRAAVVVEGKRKRAYTYLPNVREVSQWVSIANPLIMDIPAGCRWTLRTEFDLTGFDPSTARIDGGFAADNFLAELRLNGKRLPLPEGARAEDSHGKKSPLRIDGGFIAGRNTLEVVVENGGAESGVTGPTPMALNLELHGMAVKKSGTKGQ